MVTRKDFLKTAAGAAVISAMPGSSILASTGNATQKRYTPAPIFNGKPKRGVSLYSYSGVYGVTMTLEDCLKEINDCGAEGIEILANGYIEQYPNPTDEWIENWWKLMDKYNIVPGEYGHWVDSRLLKGRELSTKESYDMLIRDFKLANKLGFKVGRTKLGVIDETLTPVKNWQEFIKMALDAAEEYDFRMCPEIHAPTVLKSKMVDDYIDFIVKTGTKYFGINIDFGIFANQRAGFSRPGVAAESSKPEDMVDYLPYTYAIHAKFTNMSDDLIETDHPYPEIFRVLLEQKWEGYLLSEYEGKNKDVPDYAADQVRRQHVLMKRLLGEA